MIFGSTYSTYCNDPANPGNQLSLWMNDGNVVIQAENTLFRVHSGLLAKESSEYGVLFAKPQRADQKIYQGCPLISTKDSAVDTYYFLTALHKPRPIFDTEESQLFTAISGILRLSTKYGVPHLRKQMITALEEYYPISLDKFDNRKLWTNGATADMEILNLLRETNVRSVMPVVLYDCVAELGLEGILDGMDKPEAGKIRITDANDLRSAVLGARNLIPHLTRAVSSAVQLDDVGCYDSAVCDRNKTLWLKQVLGNGFGIAPCALATEILGGWEAFNTVACDSCVKAAKERHQRVRKDIFEVLPETFNLLKWETARMQNVDAVPEQRPGWTFEDTPSAFPTAGTTTTPVHVNPGPEGDIGFKWPASRSSVTSNHPFPTAPSNNNNAFPNTTNAFPNTTNAFPNTTNAFPNTAPVFQPSGSLFTPQTGSSFVNNLPKLSAFPSGAALGSSNNAAPTSTTPGFSLFNNNTQPFPAFSSSATSGPSNTNTTPGTSSQWEVDTRPGAKLDQFAPIVFN